MEPFTQAAIQSLIVVFIFMTIFFVYGLYKGRNDIADIIWGLGFVFIGLELFLSFKFGLTSYLILLFTFIWGIRLSAHIFIRNRNKDEDFRYKKWREDWGKWFILRSYFQIYILQGILMFVVSLTLITSVQNNHGLNYINYIGIAIWLNGFLFEFIGDLQLKKFISDKSNNGHILNVGLWKYTRHPNYFGEVTLWWGIFLISLPNTYWFLAVLSPITMTILILKVSGIPMLEKKYEGNKEFDEYKSKTNAFFPWFPKK